MVDYTSWSLHLLQEGEALSISEPQGREEAKPVCGIAQVQGEASYYSLVNGPQVWGEARLGFVPEVKGVCMVGSGPQVGGNQWHKNSYLKEIIYDNIPSFILVLYVLGGSRYTSLYHTTRPTQNNKACH